MHIISFHLDFYLYKQRKKCSNITDFKFPKKEDLVTSESKLQVFLTVDKTTEIIFNPTGDKDVSHHDQDAFVPVSSSRSRFYFSKNGHFPIRNFIHITKLILET